MRRMLPILVGVVLGCLGTWLFLRSEPPPREIPVVAAPLTTPVGPTLAEVRAVVREELQTALASEAQARCPPSLASPELPPAREPDVSSQGEADAPPSPALEPARRALDDGLARGEWNESDRERLRELLPQLEPAEREALTKQIISAANRGELKVQLSGPLF